MLAGATVLLFAVMQPAMLAMADHGASVLAFELAGSASRTEEILAEWGGAGESAAWWQLAIDLPFLVAYGLFLAGACAAVARRAQDNGQARLARAAATFAWCGPLAAAVDLLQNVSLAIVLSGQVTQPWPMISALAVPTILVLAFSALLFAIAGAFMTRLRPGAELA